MTQHQWIERLYKLHQQHPDAEVHVLADSEGLLSDFGWTAHRIGRVAYGWFGEWHENVFADPPDMLEYLMEIEEMDQETARETKDKYMRRAIVIFTEP